MEAFLSLVVILVIGYPHLINSQIAVYPLEFRDPFESHLGLGWPHVLDVVEGHVALIKLTRIMVNQASCEVRTPLGETLNLNQLPSRYEIWGDGCGIRILNITAADEGRWKLTSNRGEDSLVGYIPVRVLGFRSSLDVSTIYLQDGVPNAHVNLTTVDNYYCMVTQPFAQISLVSGHCEVTLHKTSRAIQGVWKVLLGLPGQISEVPIERQVTVEADYLEEGFIHDSASNKLHLYCNIKFANRNITFCRFQRTAETTGYNVIDGLSNGYYSYYGNGFVYKQCGMTVERPTVQDFSTWRCSVGVQEKVDGHIVQQSPMQALIGVTNTASRNSLSSTLTSDDERRVFTQSGSELTMQCHVDQALSYCWFQHPNGSQYTPMGSGLLEDQSFWYSGESLQIGDCSITFANADESLSGHWTCHMGASNNLGVEITDRILVRVSGPLAANRQEVNGSLYGKETLYCHTSGVKRSVNYCRFVSPGFVGINIDPSITADKAIMGRYYFTPNRSLDYGDCSLTIDPVENGDFGNWTCAALIVGIPLESRDYIQLNYAGTLHKHSAVAITFISIGIISLLAVIIGSVIYRDKILDLIRRRSNRTVSMAEIMRPSISSGSSTSDTINSA